MQKKTGPSDDQKNATNVDKNSANRPQKEEELKAKAYSRKLCCQP